MDKHPSRKKHFKYYLGQAKKLLRAGVITSLLLLATTLVFADKIMIPFSCYPKNVQKSFASRGYKLDLSGNDRDIDSWGFLVNEGSGFTIFTYKSVTPDELDLIKELLWEQ